MVFRSVEADSDLMREGEYEVYVKNCCFSETNGGTECVKFEFVVRSDMDQPYQNKHKFKQFYRDRDSGQWPMEKIGKYANALGIPKGQDFELDELIGLSCRMVIKHYTDKETGETRDCVFYLKSSAAQSFVQPVNEFQDIDDTGGDLPF